MGIKGQIPWNKNKKLSSDHIKHLSESHMGNKPWNVGLKGVQKHTEQFKEDRRQDALKNGLGRLHRPEFVWNKDKIGVQKWSEEQREKWFKWANTEEAQKGFRAHGVETMKNMKKKDTSIELIMEDIVCSLGFKDEYEKQVPLEKITISDGYFKKYRIILYADGEQFHNTPECIERDIRVKKELEEMGYTVLRFWGKELEKKRDFVSSKIKDTVETIRDGSSKEEQDIVRPAPKVAEPIRNALALPKQVD